MTAPHFYPTLNPNPDFPAIEAEVLHFWQEAKIFAASVQENPGIRDGKNNEFIFYDGPPFANGLPHYGHLLTGYVKDLFARYQTMKGKRVERRFGWDCHGLPAEMGAEKDLHISGRMQIMDYGIGKFNEYCRTSVMQYTREWEYYVTRQARWVDFENDYKTMDVNFMESVLWAFKELYTKGLIYESFRVMPYSWAAETPLSNFETKLDNSYREREDKAVTVAFELLEKPQGAPEAEKYFVLAWTTTPWTLPSNLALAVNAKIDYACLLKDGVAYISAWNGEIPGSFIKTAKELGVVFIEYQSPQRGSVFIYFDGKIITEKNIPKDIQQTKENTSTLHVLSGKDLLGLCYQPLFPFFENQPNAFRIIDGSDFVSEGDGTGIVHIAPGFGEDDQRVAAANGIEVVCPVDVAGKYTDEIFDLISSPLEGERTRHQPSRGGPSSAAQTFAKANRKELTPPEWKLWKEISGKKLEGFKFRRQQPIGNYIADFYSAEARLIIELDGGQHAERVDYDQKRTAFFEAAGYRVLRFWNNEAEENLEGVVGRIREVLKVSPHGSAEEASPAPPQGGSYSLKLQGLNVIADTRIEESDLAHLDPRKHEKFKEQVEKFGLANMRIIRWLDENGHLIKEETIKHNYPHCWRTDTPLIYRAMPSWYVKVSAIRDRMGELNQQINWIPNHIKNGRMGEGIKSAPDWSISRNRFWGTPIPIWRSDNPENEELYVFGSIAELNEFFGSDVTDLHRPYIDELTKPDPKNPDYTLRRVEDVFDCWFESGSMPYAQVHYPFENKEWFETHFPADFIVEYEAQTRGWFYTLMVLGTALFDKPPFLNCICHGVVMDDKGQKLSKRLNNYADPKDLFDQFGADALRWFMMSSPVMRGLEMYIDKEGKFIHDVVRLAIKPVWNAYNFFCLYANADGMQAEYSLASEQVMDRYLLAKTARAVDAIAKALDAYHTPDACEAVLHYFEILNNWYIRRSKPRFWKGERDADKQAAYNTLYTALHIMARAMAPLLPLVSEAIYAGLTNRGEFTAEHSVHLAEFPSELGLTSSETIEADMDRVQAICNTALAIRNAQNLRVRLPLASLTVVTKDPYMLAEAFQEMIRDEVNVKEILFSEAFDASATLKLQVHFPIVGKRLPEKMKQLIPAAKKGEWNILPDGTLEIAGTILHANEFALALEPKPEYAAFTQALPSNDALVMLDILLKPELEREGLARDLVRMIQQARKDAGLNVSDRIRLGLEAPEKVQHAVRMHATYISEQTLADSLLPVVMAQAQYRTEQMLDGEPLVITLTRAG